MKPLRIMIVDDENRLREALARAIGSWGFDVLEARAAAEAMKLADAQPPDIAIVDLNLPGMDGILLLEKLRGSHPNLSAIVLTGFGDLESARQAIRLDVSDFLTKPFHLGELEQAILRASQRTPHELPVAMEISSPPKTLADVERAHILEVLRRNNGSRTTAATELGISRRTLHYKLGEYARRGFEVD